MLLTVFIVGGVIGALSMAIAASSRNREEAASRFRDT